MLITRKKLRAWDACWDDEDIAELVPPEGVPILRVLDAAEVDVADRIWVGVHAMPEREARPLACDWAEQACRDSGWDDPRSLWAIAVARQYAAGEATDSELCAAWTAAWAAAEATVRTAAGAAAWAAVEATARTAARAAAGAAVGASWAAAVAAGAAGDAGAAAKVQQLADVRTVFERIDRDSLASVRRGLAQSAAGRVTPFDPASLPDEARS